MESGIGKGSKNLNQISAEQIIPKQPTVKEPEE